MRRHGGTRLNIRRIGRGAPRMSAPPFLPPLALALLVAGCAGDGAAPKAARDSGAESRMASSLPSAEQLGQDLLMVPVARDGRGCVQYRMESENRPRVQAVFYRTHAGDFSTIRGEAACT